MSSASDKTKYMNFQTAGFWLTVICAWLSLDFLLIGKSIYISTGDNGDVILSGLMANRSLDYGRTYWNIFSTTGVDRLGQGFFGFIDDYLFLRLPGWLAYQIRIISQIVAAVLATYHLCRRRLELSQAAGLMASFFYATCTTNGQLVMSVLAYLPLSILSIGWMLDRPRALGRWAIVIAVCIWIAGTGYLSRLQPFLLFVHVLWFAAVERRTRIWAWVAIVCFSIMTVILRVSDYIATVLNGQLSHRVAHSIFKDVSVGEVASNIMNFGDSFLRIAIELIFLTGFVTAFRVRSLRPCLIAFGLGLLAAISGVLVQRATLDWFPAIGSFNVVRLTLYLWIFVAIGAGIVVDHVIVLVRIREWSFVSRWLPTAVVLAIAILSLEIKYVSLKDWITQGSYTLAFESDELRDLARRVNKEGVPLRVEPFQMYPTLLHPYGLETAGGYQALHSKRYYDFWTVLIRNSKDTFRSDRLMLSPEGHKAEWNFGEEYDEDLLALANVGYVISRDRLNSKYLRPLAEAAEPWSSLSTLQKVKKNIADNFRGRRGLFIYENLRVAPRFFFAQTVLSFSTTAALLEALGETPYDVLKTSLLIETKDVPSGFDPTRVYANGSVKVTRYTPDEIVLSAETDGDSVLIGMNGYSPYWHAAIDGKLVPLMPADHAFWALPVPKGMSQIVFSYVPPWR